MKIFVTLICVALAIAVESHWHHQHRPNPTGRTTNKPQPHEATIDELYQAALAEGGRVIVYAGGDTAGQQDFTKRTFESRFPNMTLDTIVDYSKFHNGRIEVQLATNKLVPDVVHLQTVQDFPKWKQAGVLMNYKPIGWDQVYDEFKDLDGFYTGIGVLGFSNVISKILMPDNATWPTEANDYLKPEFKGKFTVTYPNDDDAVLFWFKQVVDKYGWSYVEKFAAQNPVLVRGTQEPGDAVRQARTLAAPAVSGNTRNPPEATSAFILPKQDPFVSWAQMAAIFKDAKRPAAAKLYMSFLLDLETQASAKWTVRKDGPAPAPGLKNIFNYGDQSDPTAFGKWMADRGQVEMFKTQMTLFLGEVTGEPSSGHVGMYQDVATPH